MPLGDADPLKVENRNLLAPAPNPAGSPRPPTFPFGTWLSALTVACLLSCTSDPEVIAPDAAAPSDAATADAIAGDPDASPEDAGFQDAAPDAGPQCDDDSMLCGDQCVDLSSDEAHCGACDNACGDGEECDEGACVSLCPDGQVSCDEDGASVCVSLASNAAHCGACTMACSPGEACSDSRCAPVCPGDQEDCGDDAVLCVDTNNDPSHCGGCGVACASGERCDSGACAPDCLPSQSACDVDGSELCIDTATNAAHCGACGNACGEGLSCVDSRCTLVCPPGQSECAGVCIDLDADANHCGACGNVCAAPTGGSAACMDGSCGSLCPEGQSLCGDSCIDLNADPSHCGSCGSVCLAPSGGSAECTAGSCVSTCPGGETECGGACIDLQSDAEHCGGCGNVCASPSGGTSFCSGGACVDACPGGQTACGGCCLDLNTNADHCGACDNACSAPSGGTVACAAGSCVPACPAGQSDCGGTCIDLQSDAAHCGTCSNVCAVPTGGAASCNAGSCLSLCPSGQTDCGGVCLNTQSDAAHCGACGNVCTAPTGGSVSCTAGSCVEACPAGQTNCGGVCQDTQSDTAHCGACGNVCAAPTGGSVSCTAGSCVEACPAGETACGGVCLDTQSDTAHCGACGNSCGAGESCVAGVCEPALPSLPGPTFRLDAFEDSGCASFDHDALTGDDHGGIAVSSSYVFYQGDENLGRFDRGDLSADVLPRRLETPVADLATETMYLAGDVNGPMDAAGLLSHLHPVNDDGTTIGAPIALSTPITTVGTTGFFAGWGRIVVHDGTRAHSIATPSGVVTDLGATAPPTSQSCESFAYWGIAETDGAATNLVYVSSSTEIVRQVAGTSTRTTLGTYTDLSDMCSIVASPSTNRWYFHHESDSQFAPSGGEVLGHCNAAYDTSGGNFRVTSLGTTGCSVIEHGAASGDDKGGIAVTGTHVFYTGDGGAARVELDLSNLAHPDAFFDSTVSNLRNGDLYGLAHNGSLLLPSGGTVSQLLPIDESTGRPSGSPIALSSTFSVADNGVGLFAGYDRIAVYSGTEAIHIELPTGRVTNLGAVTLPSPQACETWALWGIAEYHNGRLHLAYADTNDDIVRVRVPEGTTEVITAFGDLGDTCSISAALSLDRWYFHHENTSELITTGNENIGYCDLNWSQP